MTRCRRHVSLLDFGVLRRIAHDEGSGTDGRKFIATAQYSPPEFLAREELPGPDGFAAINIYQVGAVLHDLITKTPLFATEVATKNKYILYRAVTQRKPRLANPAIAPRLVALCAAALEKNPAIRANSVSLQDFLADADDIDTLRRRVARGGGRAAAQQSPSQMVWAPKVRAWVRAAAQLEREALGAVTVKDLALRGGQRWRVAFHEAPAPVFVELKPSDEGFEVQVVSAVEPPTSVVVFRIGADGADLPEAGIPGALAAQYLNALDLALATQAPVPPEAETAA